MVKAMNAIGYDAMAPGNWEFMFDKDHFLDLIDFCLLYTSPSPRDIS